MFIKINISILYIKFMLNLNLLLSKLIKCIHIYFILFAFVGPYVYNDHKTLLFLIFLYIFIMTQWYLFNRCLLTDIEYKLEGKKITKYADGSSKNFIVDLLEKNLYINEKILFYIFVLMPLINNIITIIKLNTLFNKCTMTTN
jgi:hypothetical protein